MNWKARRDKFINNAVAGNSELHRFTSANAGAIEAVIAGWGPDDTTVDPDAGARMVVNISSAHVPAFCEASRKDDPKPYKNGYDLGKYRVGDPPPDEALKSREIVDRALPLKENAAPNRVYFGAIELNGSGIRFYGDVCLVLRRDALDADTVVLDRNSYDLIRAPIRDVVDAQPPAKQALVRQSEARKLQGSWSQDLGLMATLKVFQSIAPRARRYTTGQISEAVRDDEDYMEVLKIDSFGTDKLQEARLSAAEAAYDALTGDRLLSRPAPRLEALIWRYRRRRAEDALRRSGIRVRVVTTSGRTKD